MNKTTKILFGVVAIALIAMFGWMLHISSSHSSSQTSNSYGSTVDTNPWWYPNGVATGNLSSLYLSDTLTLSTGQNQVAWKNNTGQSVKVMIGTFETTGTASSTTWFNVGTSTTATATDVFTAGTSAPMWSQFIDGFKLSTSTVAGLWADNFVNHKSGYPAELIVPAGQYLLFTASNWCTAPGACENATSTNRGWNATVPFRYYAAGGN